MEELKEEKPQADVRRMAAKQHAVQLVAFQTTELRIKVTGDPSALDQFEGCPASLEASHSAYNEAEQTIQVRVRAVVTESEEAPLSIYVEVVGRFKVDESRFDKNDVVRWAQVNAPYTLYPYVREHVFSLASRVGAKGLIMPLLEIPTFKIVPPQSATH